jgi:hypothetical protein
MLTKSNKFFFLILLSIIVSIVFFGAVLMLFFNSIDNDHLSKEQIISIVEKNRLLLSKVPDEIKKFNEPFISTTTKSPIENEMSDSSCNDLDNIEGLYIIEHFENGFLVSNIENDIFQQVLNISGVMDIANYNMSENNRFAVFFSCGGEGFGSAASYYGFYYTADNRPVGCDEMDHELIQDPKGWSWMQDNSDNTYYTERIIDNWFYYEEHY